jgi:hypothetical protein
MVARSGPGWALAPSLGALIDQTDRLWPNRSRVSDGSIGDAAHQATTSDHNPRDGFVTAVDITEDLEHGPDLWALWHHLVDGRDPRVKYLIYERRIIKSYVDPAGRPAWIAQPYDGINAHATHLHVSVLATDKGLRSPLAWYGFAPGAGVHNPALKIPDRDYPGVVQLGDQGDAVGAWQQALAERGARIVVDGIYGPATHHVVVDWQAKHGLIPDGIAGPRTWHTVLFA